MKDSRVKEMLDEIARQGIPQDVHLWQGVAAELEKRRRPPLTALRRARPLAAFLLAVLILLALSGVGYAVSRLLGYIYLPEFGFYRAASAFVLQQPVMQEHGGRRLTISSGIATPQETLLWLEFSDNAAPADGARLETPAGKPLPLVWWEYRPNAPGARRLRLVFPPLPAGVTQTTLVLPEGWRLPLTWIPAAQSPLPEVQVFPYPAAPAGTPAAAKEAAEQAQACQQHNGVELCLRAAAVTTESTAVLLEARSLLSQLTPGDGDDQLVWLTESQRPTLRDEQGNVLPLQSAQGRTLFFPPLSAGEKAVLRVPAVLARVTFPEQRITVALGDDPQPGQVIPLDAAVQVLGIPVHFSRAALIGDGVNSLRLTLDADPVPTLQGITPLMLEMAKPDRVDDLYGSGMLTGSQDVFVELMRPQGKLSGTLHLPVVSALVAVEGAFEFTFTLPPSQTVTLTPVTAAPQDFSPVPTATPLTLDAYTFSGQALQPGDLLYTVIEGDQTQVEVFHPASGAASRPLATLPGAVAQIFLHPDRQGMDYLAGVQTVRDGFTYIDHLRLYTLRFNSPAPRLLYTFPPNPQNTIGTSVLGEWSWDGRFAFFRLASTLPGSGGWRYLWLDLSCREQGNCTAQKYPLRPGLDFFQAVFAPQDYRLLFSGSDYSGSGKMDFFLLDFDPAVPERQPRNLTGSYAVGDGITPAVWIARDQIFTACAQRADADAEASAFCLLDPQSGALTFLDALNLPDGWRLAGGYWISSEGAYLAALIFPKNARWGETLPELRLFDQNGQELTTLAATLNVSAMSFSAASAQTAFIYDEGSKLAVYDIQTGIRRQVYASPAPAALSWLGWVR
jgi:hypothetical protein